MKHFVDVLLAGILGSLIAAYLYATWALGQHVLHGPDVVEPRDVALLGDIGAYALGGMLIGMAVRILQLWPFRARGGPPQG